METYTKVPNEILDHLIRLNLSDYESRTLHAILRKTYGFQEILARDPDDPERVQNYMSIRYLSELTGIGHRNQQRAINSLVARRIITKEKPIRRGLRPIDQSGKACETGERRRQKTREYAIQGNWRWWKKTAEKKDDQNTGVVSTDYTQGVSVQTTHVASVETTHVASVETTNKETLKKPIKKPCLSGYPIKSWQVYPEHMRGDFNRWIKIMSQVCKSEWAWMKLHWWIQHLKRENPSFRKYTKKPENFVAEVRVMLNRERQRRRVVRVGEVEAIPFVNEEETERRKSTQRRLMDEYLKQQK